MAQPLQVAGQDTQETFVFRLLGSVYKKSAGEGTSVPTVVEVEVVANNQEAAQKQVARLFEKLNNILTKEEQYEFMREEFMRKQHQGQKEYYDNPPNWNRCLGQQTWVSDKTNK